MLAVVLATVGVVAAGYEWVAVRTRRVPTITRLVKALPVPLRVAVVAAAVVVTVDHFLLGAWL